MALGDLPDSRWCNDSYLGSPVDDSPPSSVFPFTGKKSNVKDHTCVQQEEHETGGK